MENQQIKGLVSCTGLVDIDNREIKIGDKIQFCYADPISDKFEDDSLEEDIYTVDFLQGCVVGTRHERDPIPLRDRMVTREGPYISNYHNLTIFVDNVVHCKIVNQ